MAGEGDKSKWVGVRPTDPAVAIPVSLAAIPDPDVNLIKIAGTALTGADWTAIFKTLNDDTLKGLLRSIGDAGAAATDQAGYTLLGRLLQLFNNTRSLNGDTGFQIPKSNTCTNVAVIIHTVTAGKTYYLNTATLSLRCNAASEQSVSMYVRETGDVTIFTMLKCWANTDQGRNSSIPFMPPMKIPAGYDICIISSNANAHGAGFVMGWEE